MPKPNAAAVSFESRLDRLEAIVHELEGDQIELARALELFEEGVECLRGASKELADARAYSGSSSAMTEASTSPTFVADRGSVAGAYDSSVVAEVEEHRRRIDDGLASICKTELTTLDATAPRVAEAIRYSLVGGGKRFRGTLFLAAYRAAGGYVDATSLAAAIEIVHAYSLVHDDLPCMDDDDVRRGRPTVHRRFDTQTATIAGLAMVPLAARAAAHAAKRLPKADARRVVAELMSAAGAGGMIGGQMLDLEGEGKPLSLTELEQIHRGKTGA